MILYGYHIYLTQSANFNIDFNSDSFTNMWHDFVLVLVFSILYGVVMVHLIGLYGMLLKDLWSFWIFLTFPPFIYTFYFDFWAQNKNQNHNHNQNQNHNHNQNQNFQIEMYYMTKMMSAGA